MTLIHWLGVGRLRVLHESMFDDDLMLGLDDPFTGRRITLCQVPTGKRAQLVAVAIGTKDDLPSGPHYADGATTGFTLGSGVLRANQPAAGLGPADRIGFELEGDRTVWHHRLLDAFKEHRVRLEVHPPECACGQAAPDPTQRNTTGQEARR